MSAPDPMVDIATLTARVLAAAVAYVDAPPEPRHEDPTEPGWSAMMEGLYGALAEAVRGFQAACGPRTLTWDTVPAGWEVQAPDGKWYRVEATYQRGLPMPRQRVTLAGLGAWDRDPRGPVTARPGVPSPTDAALAALGFPEILEDKS